MTFVEPGGWPWTSKLSVLTSQSRPGPSPRDPATTLCEKRLALLNTEGELQAPPSSRMWAGAVSSAKRPVVPADVGARCGFSHKKACRGSLSAVFAASAGARAPSA